MILSLEIKKLKRTGYLPAFLGGGLIAAAFPLANMLVRPDIFTSLTGNPFIILLDANWQMMAMLNILVSICGACLMYHTEYTDNGAQKMDVLPIPASRIFLSKFIIATLALTVMLIIEAVTLTGCATHWFPGFELNIADVLKYSGFSLLVTLPTVMLMLVIASACQNMWVSLGIGVILVFTLSILPQENVVLSLFPFSSPYQTLALENNRIILFLIVCGVETVLFALVELIYQKVRRCFE